MTPTRVLILGGGCAGVAAAWSLSRTAEDRAKYRVTIMQSGFRLGGKGATGRDPDRNDAVLEHGLHLWLGFYHKAFAMMADVFDAWDAPAEGPLRSLETAFQPLRDVALVGREDDLTDVWNLRLPMLPGRPWHPPGLSRNDVPDLLGLARDLVRAVALLKGSDGLGLRRLATVRELGTVMALGLAKEVARHGRDAYDHMNDSDLRAWLREHGASDAVADCPPVRALYDLGFAYPDGVGGPGRGAMAAGAGVRVLTKLAVGYRGAPFYRMTAGMGDTVFAPLYEVLRARGVSFAFFHDVQAIRTTGGAVSEVVAGVQAEPWDMYEPLTRVGPTPCWPDRPLRAQLDRVCEGRLDGDHAPYLFERTLRAGHDFDAVILAIPPGTFARIATDVLASSEKMRAMVAAHCAVPTVAAQYWLAKSPLELGHRGTPGVMTGIGGALRTWADMSDVLAAEGWSDPPASLSYFCSVAPPRVAAQPDEASALREAEDEVRAFEANVLPRLWPRIQTDARGVNPSELHAEGSRTVRPYVRVNYAAWERYNLTLPGSVRFRLRPDESGVGGLYLAGDWTRNDIDGGSVEGAVSSGIDAAAAVRRGGR